jgi:RNA polymerase sigma factor (sigma-70 family)
MPPPAEGFAARFVVGPALRTQPDRRLVTLVREGYENAFEEIVRRYGKPLTRYAAAIVGGRAEDVTQDAFSKALLALRRDGKEIELRPWLFRIVRNTALNELRDRPIEAEALAEAIAGGTSPEEEIERREELADLMRRLRSLPEAQRAAIVMRELEGLSHDEIAAALGLSGGGARQAIFRARRALRDGAGMLLPLPLLKTLMAGATSGPIEAAAGAASVGGVAGAGVAVKATVATVLVAGAVGAGVAIDHNHQPNPQRSARASGVIADDSPAASDTLPGSGLRDDSGSDGHERDDDPSNGEDHGRHSSEDRGGRGGRGSGDDGSASAGDDGGNRGPGGSGHLEAGDDHGGREGSSGRGGESSDDGEDRSGGSSGSGDGSGGSGSSGDDGGSSSGPGSGSSGSGSGVSGGDDSSGASGSGSGSSSGDNSGSGSSGDELSSGSGSGSSGGSGSSESGGDDSSNSSGSGDSRDGGGFSLRTEPQS